MRPSVDFIFFDAGGGHRAAATALQAAIAHRFPEWEVRLVDLQDVLDELDIFRKATGLRLEEIYNTLLERGWTLGSTQMLPFMHGIIRLYHPAQVRLLTRFWSHRKPSMVVSLVPNFNRGMWQALQNVDPEIPFITVLTDMADYPPHFWIERQKQIFVCGTDRAIEQVHNTSPESTAYRASGMILHPRFYDVPPLDVEAERIALGLDPDKRTGLVMFGGMGSGKMTGILDRIDASALDLQLIMICGKNEALRKSLTGRSRRVRTFIEGFTREVPRYMRLADFFIGKPGPGSISEAVEMGLPVVVEKNGWTLPQERFNADWVADQGVGVSLSSFSHLVPALEELLQPERLAATRAKVKAIRNRAVFEIPEILGKILKCDLPVASS